MTSHVAFLWITLERIGNSTSRSPCREVTRQRRRRPSRLVRKARASWCFGRRTWRSKKSVASPVRRRTHRGPRIENRFCRQPFVVSSCRACLAKPCPSGPRPSSSRRSPSNHSVTNRAKPALPRRINPHHAKPCRSFPNPAMARLAEAFQACVAVTYQSAPCPS